MKVNTELLQFCQEVTARAGGYTTADCIEKYKKMFLESSAGIKLESLKRYRSRILLEAWCEMGHCLVFVKDIRFWANRSHVGFLSVARTQIAAEHIQLTNNNEN